MAEIQAIETHYAGCRFRSRLEARWGVFFDTLGIRWEYEPQGYVVGPLGRRYLPDFWLPDLGTWVEVKGAMTGLDLSLLDDAVTPGVGLPYTDAFGDLSVTILGPVPEPGAPQLHWQVYRTAYAPCTSDKDFCACRDMQFRQVTFRGVTSVMLAVLRDDPALADVPSPGALLIQVDRSLLQPPCEDIVAARVDRTLIPDILVAEAYRKARSARFEYGESGAA